MDAYWPQHGRYETRQTSTAKNGTIEVQNYECRLRNGVKIDGTAIQLVQCTTRTVKPIVITIERLGTGEHLHSLGRSREVAPLALSIHAGGCTA